MSESNGTALVAANDIDAEPPQFNGPRLDVGPSPANETALLAHYYMLLESHPRLWDIEHAVRDLRDVGATWQDTWLHVERAVRAIVAPGDCEIVMRVLLHAVEWRGN